MTSRTRPFFCTNEQNGVVLPISLVCKMPHMVQETGTYELLVQEDDINHLPTPPSARSIGSAAKPPMPPTATAQYFSSEESSSEEETESDDEDESESREGKVLDPNNPDDMDEFEDPTSRAMHEIFRFIASLRTKGILSQEQSVSLEEILFENSTLLFAAYSVAVSARDAEYFAQICCGIAQSLETQDGRATCVAQDEVLQACDRLFLAKKITENQLLYLRHLVLIRDDAIGQIYDTFTESEDLSNMVRSLYLLANNHPNPEEVEEQEEEDYVAEEETSSEEETEEDTEDDADEIRGKQTFGPSSEMASARLQTVVQQMFAQQMIDQLEGRVLLEMIADGDEYCRAAYEVWCHDENVAELCDTLIRCAKLEVRKRAAANSQAAIQQAIAEDPQSYPNYGEEYGEERGDSEPESESESESEESESSESEEEEESEE